MHAEGHASQSRRHVEAASPLLCNCRNGVPGVAQLLRIEKRQDIYLQDRPGLSGEEEFFCNRQKEVVL
jgi:hypothetical protein